MTTLGSSDAPAIAGVSPHEHGSPWQTWARLVGLLPEPPTTAAMEWGTRLEALIVDEIATELDADSVQGAYPRISDIRPWQRATPDGLAYLRYGEPWLMEAKAIRGPVPDEPRLDWLVQAQWQLSVWPDFQGVALGAFGDLACRVWRIEPHAALQDALIRKGEHFMYLVETCTPPPVEARDNAWLAKAYPLAETMRVLTLGEDALRLDAERLAGIEQEKAGKARRDAAEAQIKALMGDAHTAVLPGGTVYTWAPTKRRAYAVEETVVRTLRRRGAKGEEEAHERSEA